MFLEVFAGCGNLSRHLRRRGHAVIAIDIERGPHFDIRFEDVFQTIKGWITSRVAWGLWCGTPCEALSQARRAPPWSRMPRRLRDAQHVRGLPELAASDRQLCNLSNMLADRAGRLQTLAYDYGLLGGEENPNSSWLWSFPFRKKLERELAFTPSPLIIARVVGRTELGLGWCSGGLVLPGSCLVWCAGVVVCVTTRAAHMSN